MVIFHIFEQKSRKMRCYVYYNFIYLYPQLDKTIKWTIYVTQNGWDNIVNGEKLNKKQKNKKGKKLVELEATVPEIVLYNIKFAWCFANQMG